MNVKSCLMSWFLCMVVAESYSFPPMSRLSRSSRKLHLCYSAANCECHYWWVYMFLFFFLYRSVYSNWVALLARPYHHWLRWTTAGTEAQLVFGPCIWKKRWKGGGVQIQVTRKTRSSCDKGWIELRHVWFITKSRISQEKGSRYTHVRVGSREPDH